MFTKLLTSLTLGLGLLSTAASAQSITGSGTISVIVGGTFSEANPANSTVGCVNALGKVTLDDCATFTVDSKYHMSSSEGICSFYNSSQPANTDAVYGSSVHAFYCWEHTAVSTDVQFYTITGFPYEWMCRGDTSCYYDIPAIPETSEDEINLWFFVWGSAQRDVPDGHYQALLLWEPTS